MNVSPQLDLFDLDGGAASVFQIFPREAEEGPLRDWIELGGGMLISHTEDDPYKIVIIDVEWYERKAKVQVPDSFPVNVDCFSPFFIYDSYTRQKVEDLNDYRIGSSQFAPYDANNVLQRKVSWTELQRVDESSIAKSPIRAVPRRCQSIPENGENVSRSVSPAKSDDSSVTVELQGRVNGSRSPTKAAVTRETSSHQNGSMNDDESSELESISESTEDTRSKSAPPIKKPYSRKDDEAILNYICTNNLHAFTGGIDMWKQMAKKCKELKGRTYQSLKERFRKKIQPKLADFELSADDKKKFRLAESERARGRRRPLQST